MSLTGQVNLRESSRRVEVYPPPSWPRSPCCTLAPTRPISASHDFLDDTSLDMAQSYCLFRMSDDFMLTYQTPLELHASRCVKKESNKLHILCEPKDKVNLMVPCLKYLKVKVCKFWMGHFWLRVSNETSKGSSQTQHLLLATLRVVSLNLEGKIKTLQIINSSCLFGNSVKRTTTNISLDCRVHKTSQVACLKFPFASHWALPEWPFSS